MIKMKKLAYDVGDLAPHLSKDQVDYHYNKHTKKYFDTVNSLIEGSKLKGMSLEEIVSKKRLVQEDSKLFANAAQAWNHEFYWQCLSPESSEDDISPELQKQLEIFFDTVAKFKKEFIEQGKEQLGSGWVWLVFTNGKLQIHTTPNANTPLQFANRTPLLCVDVWEHSYLYDPTYVADRGKYLKNIWSIVNWKFVSENFARAAEDDKNVKR